MMLLDLGAIINVLPHRHPMLLVDQVEVSADFTKAVGYKRIRFTDAPPSPRMANAPCPASYVLESFCQTGGVLCACKYAHSQSPQDHVMFTTVAETQFFEQVFEDDILRHTVRFLRAVGGAVIFQGETSVDGRPVLRVERVVGTAPSLSNNTLSNGGTS